MNAVFARGGQMETLVGSRDLLAAARIVSVRAVNCCATVGQDAVLQCMRAVEATTAGEGATTEIARAVVQ